MPLQSLREAAEVSKAWPFEEARKLIARLRSSPKSEVIFDEVRAERVIRTVRPDVLVKGEDYQGQVVDGQKYVESYGGVVALAPLLEGHSTTATVARLGEAKATDDPARLRRAAKSPRRG